ncbi:hypothetical protein BD626DRAFT_426109 [Schizophyllum amplum]|uniref:Uncharacterized protein n=1 Tax=Schizophyllum amplum TaxID=97359 RepID=A0A550CPB0_9AGAR|nr:hypothetical protein BD626DRAFT_426109 [Auriculariopsis ampla]
MTSVSTTSPAPDRTCSFKQSDSPITSPLPPLREWQTRRHSSHHVLGFELTEAIARRYCQEEFPIPEGASELKVEAHLTVMEDVVPDILGRKFAVPIIPAPLVKEPSALSGMTHVIALADNWAPQRRWRQPPSPEVVDQIADELQLEGAEREPRWYKCVDQD